MAEQIWIDCPDCKERVRVEIDNDGPTPDVCGCIQRSTTTSAPTDRYDPWEQPKGSGGIQYT